MGRAFHPLKSAKEFAVGVLQGDFRVGADEARDIYGGEEQVADFFFEMREIGRRGFGVGVGFKLLFRGSLGQVVQRVDNFGFFFVDFFEDAAQVFPVEADAGRAARELVGFQRGGQRFGDVAEN